MAAYCTDADVLAFLPAGGLPNPARAVTALAAFDVIELEGHGLTLDTPVLFRAEVYQGVLPSPLVEDTTYYAIPVTAERFSVASAPSGSAINLTTNGANFSLIAPLPMAEWREWGARQVDALLPPHVVPIIAPYPLVVVQANAEFAALQGTQKTSGAVIDWTARIDAIRIRLKDWARGMPLRGAARSVTSPANLAVTSTAGASDPRGWAPNGNGVLP